MKIKSVQMYMLMFSIFGLGGMSLLNQALLTSAMYTPPGGGGNCFYYENIYNFPGNGWVKQTVNIYPPTSGLTTRSNYYMVSINNEDSVEGYVSLGIYRLYIEGDYYYTYWFTTYGRYLKLVGYYDASTGESWSTISSMAL